MKMQEPALTDDFDNPLITIEEDEEAHEDDLWFLPGPRALAHRLIFELTEVSA